jgi:hypothetical protein
VSQSGHDWQRHYECALQEAESQRLFKRIEVAEAAILTRRESLRSTSAQHGERKAIEEALAHLRFLKRSRLGFGGTEEDMDD